MAFYFFQAAVASTVNTERHHLALSGVIFHAARMLERMNIKRINIAEGILPNVGSELRDERSPDGSAASSSCADLLAGNNFHIPLASFLSYHCYHYYCFWSMCH